MLNCQARPQAFEGAVSRDCFQKLPKRCLKVATVSAEMMKSGKESHKLTILFVKKFCLTSNLDLSSNSLTRSFTFLVVTNHKG